MSSFNKENNITRQEEELDVLDSIYTDEILVNSYQYDVRKLEMQITPEAKLRITLTQGYPSSEGPQFELIGRDLVENVRQEVLTRMNQVYLESGGEGEVVLYECIELCKEILCQVNVIESNEKIRNEKNIIEDEIIVHENADIINAMTLSMMDKDIYHGEPITDRKSVFQAHVCEVLSKGDVTWVLQQLLMDKKIQRAHHPCMYAYRIRQSQPDKSHGDQNGIQFSTSASSILLADNDDDGEAGAGSKLANLLDLLNVENVIVVVTRWYGGIHLGPDRFKHIANSARIALAECGYVDAGQSHKKGKKNQQRNKQK